MGMRSSTCLAPTSLSQAVNTKEPAWAQADLSRCWLPGLSCCPLGQSILGSSQNKTEINPAFLAVKQYHNYVFFNFRN